VIVAVIEEMPLGEQDRARARRRWAAYAALIAAVLLVAGCVLARQAGTRDIGVLAFGYGLGVAVAAALLALRLGTATAQEVRPVGAR
jgi:hypothetical protein